MPEGYPLINLGAWNDDPIVIQAIKEKIDAQLERAWNAVKLVQAACRSGWLAHGCVQSRSLQASRLSDRFRFFPARDRYAGRVAPQQDITKLVVEGTTAGADSSRILVSSGSVRLHLGNRYGCLVGVLGHAQGAIPTLIFKWWLPDPTLLPLAAGMVVVGHNWPVYYGFQGGTGISAVWAGCWSSTGWGAWSPTSWDWPAICVIRQMPLISFGRLAGLMVPWIWIRPHAAGRSDLCPDGDGPDLLGFDAPGMAARSFV